MLNSCFLLDNRYGSSSYLSIFQCVIFLFWCILARSTPIRMVESKLKCLLPLSNMLQMSWHCNENKDTRQMSADRRSIYSTFSWQLMTSWAISNDLNNNEGKSCPWIIPLKYQFRCNSDLFWKSWDIKEQTPIPYSKNKGKDLGTIIHQWDFPCWIF